MLASRADRSVRNLEVGLLESEIRSVFAGKLTGSLSLDLNSYFGFLNALDAISAFLHDSAHAYRHVGVFPHGREGIVFLTQGTLVKFIGVAFVPIEEIEAPDLVGAVVRAITGSDATIVGHGVHAFLVMNGRIDRANRFAWSRLAVHAGDPLKGDLNVGGNLGSVSFGRTEVTIESDPVHLTSPEYLILSYDRYVVFALAGNYAGAAAGALIEIDRHAPLVESESIGLLMGVIRMLIG